MYMGVSTNRSILGVSLFLETPIYIYIYIIACLIEMFVECHPRTLTEVVKHLSLIQKDQSIHDTLRIHGTNGIFAYMDGRLFIIDVGKYTSPLDPMGQFLLHIFLEQKLHDEYSIGGRLPQRKTTLDTLKFFCGFTSAGVHKRFFFPEI